MATSTLESRVASLSLGGYVGWQCRIDLALSESSACSSPTSEASEFDHMLDDDADNEADLIDGVKVDATPEPSTLVQQMVSSLAAIGERPLLEHLFWNPVTLVDLEALVPALLKSQDIMDRLVANIGYFNAYGLISPPNLERMLIHLLAVGDDQHYLYETTKARIELERKRRERLEHVDHYKWIKGHGMTDIAVNNIHHCEMIGDFSRSRLHNGPGLTDRKRARVRLPQKDTRKVSGPPNLLVSEITTKVTHDNVRVGSRSSPDFPFGERVDKTVVKLPPKEPAPAAHMSVRTLATKELDATIPVFLPSDTNNQYRWYCWSNRVYGSDQI